MIQTFILYYLTLFNIKMLEMKTEVSPKAMFHIAYSCQGRSGTYQVHTSHSQELCHSC